MPKSHVFADPSGRRWRLLTRGGALLGFTFAVLSTVFVVSFLGLEPIDVIQGFWRAFALATATTFILVAGVSISLSSARAAAYLGGREIALKNLGRGAGIFLVGMGITAVTWLFVRDEFILFGVLHCIGLSIALSPLFLRFGRGNLLLGSAIVLLGPFIGLVNGPLALAWLGIHPADFASLDYVPLIPWLGVFLIGMSIGASLYPGGRRGYPAPGRESSLLNPVTFLGRHSLPVYLVHVPVILLVLALFIPGLAPRLIALFMP